VATFASNRGAAMKNMGNGPAISVHVDNADPREALRVLRAVHGLGEPAVVTMTGSVWECPAAHEPVPKRHFHWRLSAPTTTPAEHARLHAARRLAAVLVGADRGLAPPVHPIRGPGSLNRKAEPVLAVIETINANREVHLDEALAALRKAVEAANRERGRAFVDRLDRAGPVGAMAHVPNSGARRCA